MGIFVISFSILIWTIFVIVGIKHLKQFMFHVLFLKQDHLIFRYQLASRTIELNDSYELFNNVRELNEGAFLDLIISTNNQTIRYIWQNHSVLLLKNNYHFIIEMTTRVGSLFFNFYIRKTESGIICSLILIDQVMADSQQGIVGDDYFLVPPTNNMLNLLKHLHQQTTTLFRHHVAFCLIELDLSMFRSKYKNKFIQQETINDFLKHSNAFLNKKHHTLVLWEKNYFILFSSRVLSSSKYYQFITKYLTYFKTHQNKQKILFSNLQLGINIVKPNSKLNLEHEVYYAYRALCYAKALKLQKYVLYQTKSIEQPLNLSLPANNPINIDYIITTAKRNIDFGGLYLSMFYLNQLSRNFNFYQTKINNWITLNWHHLLDVKVLKKTLDTHKDQQKANNLYFSLPVWLVEHHLDKIIKYFQGVDHKNIYLVLNNFEAFAPETLLQLSKQLVNLNLNLALEVQKLNSQAFELIQTKHFRKIFLLQQWNDESFIQEKVYLQLLGNFCSKHSIDVIINGSVLGEINIFFARMNINLFFLDNLLFPLNDQSSIKPLRLKFFSHDI